MSRISTALATAFGTDAVPIFILLELQFDSGTVRLSTLIQSLTWNTYTWTPAGGNLKFNFPDETGEVRATGGSIELSGLDPSYIALADTENYQGRRCNIYIGAFDSSGVVVVDPDPNPWFIDVMEPAADGETATIVVAIESRMAPADRPNERRYTPEDQALRYEGDKGFDFVASLQNKEIIWGAPG